MKNIIKTVRVSVLFLGLLVSYVVSVYAAPPTLKKSEGFVAVRLVPNTDYWQYLYFKNSLKSDVATFFSFTPVSQTRFSYRGDRSIILKALPVGRYYWKSYHTSGGGELQLLHRKKIAFVIRPNKVTYVGDINIVTKSEQKLWKSSSYVTFPVKNRALAAKKEINTKYPSLLRKYKFVTQRTSLK